MRSSPSLLFAALFAVLVVLAGCADDHEHGAGADHSHGDEADHHHDEGNDAHDGDGHDGDDHDHGEGEGDHAHDGDDHGHGGEDAWAFTAWGERYEIFAETDPLVAGESANSHTHVTVLDGFGAPEEGRVSAVLRSPAGSEQVFTRDRALRSGIFDVAITPRESGEHELLFRVESAAGMEEIPAGRVRVGTVDEAGEVIETPELPAGGPAGEPVSFLKEQQWQTDFATDWVRAGELAETVSGLATVRPVAGGEVALGAPLDAVVLAAKSWPYPGQVVRAGETVLRLAPRIGSERTLADLEAETRVRDGELEVARTRLGRLERLLAVEAVSQREVEEARARVSGLEARLEAARRGLQMARAARQGAGGGEVIALRAPWSGQVAAVHVSPGEAVDAGGELVRLVKTDPLWLEVRLRPAEVARLGAGAAGLALRLPGRARPLDFAAGAVRLVSRFPEADARTGTVGVLFEMPGNDPALRPGVVGEAEVALAETRSGIVIPSSAIVDDAGAEVVYVQLDGESFARREVRVLARRGARLLVEGLAAGERLVTTGGAAIRRASLLAGGGAQHGHVH